MGDNGPPATERLYSVAQAVELVTGTRPSPATAFRWAKRGIRGVRLTTVRVGGRRKASVESVQRFLEATTTAVDGPAPAPTVRSNRARDAAIGRAERELQSVGG